MDGWINEQMDVLYFRVWEKIPLLDGFVLDAFQGPTNYMILLLHGLYCTFQQLCVFLHHTLCKTGRFSSPVLIFLVNPHTSFKEQHNFPNPPSPQPITACLFQAPLTAYIAPSCSLSHQTRRLSRAKTRPDLPVCPGLTSSSVLALGIK